MIGKLINLPFKVLGKAARAVQERNDSVMKEVHGEGTSGDDWSELENVPAPVPSATENPVLEAVTTSMFPSALTSSACSAISGVWREPLVIPPPTPTLGVEAPTARKLPSPLLT